MSGLGLFLLAACQPQRATSAAPGSADKLPGGDYSLSLTLSDYEVFDGMAAQVVVTRLSDWEEIVSESITISGDGFALSWLEVLEAGESYYVDYYVDKNSNSGCDSEDAAWRTRLDAVSGDQALIKKYGDDNELNFDACFYFPAGDIGLYDFHFSGPGYTTHLFENAYMNVLRGRAVVATGSTFVDDGTVRWYWTDTLEYGETYVLDWWVDTDHNGECNLGDHGWTLPLDDGNPVTSDVRMVVLHNDPPAGPPFDLESACDSF